MSDEAEPEVMSVGFEPPSAGRPPIINAEPIIRKVIEVQGQYGSHRWVAFKTYSEREVRSLRRQLLERGYEASVAKEDGHAVLYVRSPQ